MTIPDKSNILNTYIMTFMFCLPFAGSMELFVFLCLGQLLFIGMVYAAFRKHSPSVLLAFKQTSPKTFFLFVGWLIAMALSWADTWMGQINTWHKIAIVARQLFILIEVGFLLALIRFLQASGKPFSHILLSFGLGFIGITLLHFLILWFGPGFDSETWLKDPFLSPNMRDIGDLASAAIAIFTAYYCFAKNARASTVFLVLFTISWAYLLWTGGRTAIAATFLVNVITLLVCRVTIRLPMLKITALLAALIVAYLLCEQFRLYEWNGLMRYSPAWQEPNAKPGDITSNRMEMWIWSTQVFLQQPWLGLGPYGFFFIPERYTHMFYHDHPHNLLIQCLIEWGVIGTVFFLGLIGSLLYRGARKLKTMLKQNNADFLATAGIITILTLGSLTGGSYWDYQPVIILVTGFACFPGLNKPAKPHIPASSTGS